MTETKRFLFVCTRNKLRSATAETVFTSQAGVEAIGCGTNTDSPTVISGDLIEWADIVFVMEPVHRSKLNKKYGELLRTKRLVCLGIPDNYEYMQPELVELLQNKVAGYL